MPAYNTGTGGTVGALLRKIEEEKTQNPALVPPGSQAGEAARGTVQTPVLRAESPESSRVVSVPAEGVTGANKIQAPENITPKASMTGFPSGIGGGMGIDMWNIPQMKQGMIPKATPIEAQPTIPLTNAPSPKSYIQTPGVQLGTKITSKAVPFSYEAGRTGAESLISFANSELQNISKVASDAGFDSEAGQAALDRLQKIDAQLKPLVATAPSYLKTNLQALGQQVAELRRNAVLTQTQSFREIPAWANEAERAEAQGVLDQIAEAERQRAEYEAMLAAQQENGDNGGSDGGSNNGSSAGNRSSSSSQPRSSGGTSSSGNSTYRDAINAIINSEAWRPGPPLEQEKPGRYNASSPTVKQDVQGYVNKAVENRAKSASSSGQVKGTSTSNAWKKLETPKPNLATQILGWLGIKR